MSAHRIGHGKQSLRLKKLTLTAISLFLIAASLPAHHSYPMFYDLTQQVILKGQVTEVSFKDPHVMLTIETKGSGTWKAEWTNTATLARQGVNDNTVHVGDVLEIVASPARNTDSRVVSALWELRRPADQWRWVSTSTRPGPRTIE